MNICVLQPSYEGSTSDYQHYDPPRDISMILPDHTFHYAFLKKISTFKQLCELKKKGFDLYVNLCEGYIDSDIASIDVIWALDHLNLPYTGPSAVLYDPPKDIMKLVAYSAGVRTPDYVVAENEVDISLALEQLCFPLFVKPCASGDSRGIDRASLVTDAGDLRRKVLELLNEYEKAIIEEYVDGREFTVLVYADPDPSRPPTALVPLEFIFPEGKSFKTYNLKVRQYHPECNVPCREPRIAEMLKEAACNVFKAFSGEGYARMDFRLSGKNEVYFLEVNFACSVFYPEGYYGSADYILMHDELGHAGFLSKIIEEGLARHARKQKSYFVKHAGCGYGIFATMNIPSGEVIFNGEEAPHRIVTHTHVEKTWSEENKEVFYRYAYPAGGDTYILWHRDPARWAPQNHSCDPNTAFRGLNVIAIRDIPRGEELTIDYSDFCDERMIPFDCVCGSTKCRGKITGTKIIHW